MDQRSPQAGLPEPGARGVQRSKPSWRCDTSLPTDRGEQMNDSLGAGAPLPGAIRLPDGGWVRGRGLRHDPSPGPDPTLVLYQGAVSG